MAETQVIVGAGCQAEFPEIDQLGLTSDERRALARQGGIATERRGGQQLIHKLRFRFNGRQRVVYLGVNVDRVGRIAEELDVLRQSGRFEAGLRELTLQARRLLRDMRRRIAPILEEAGYHLHGSSLRKRRHPSHGQSRPCWNAE